MLWVLSECSKWAAEDGNIWQIFRCLTLTNAPLTKFPVRMFLSSSGPGPGQVKVRWGSEGSQLKRQKSVEIHFSLTLMRVKLVHFQFTINSNKQATILLFRGLAALAVGIIVAQSSIFHSISIKRFPMCKHTILFRGFNKQNRFFVTRQIVHSSIQI